MDCCPVLVGCRGLRAMVKACVGLITCLQVLIEWWVTFSIVCWPVGCSSRVGRLLGI